MRPLRIPTPPIDASPSPPGPPLTGSGSNVHANPDRHSRASRRRRSRRPNCFEGRTWDPTGIGAASTARCLGPSAHSPAVAPTPYQGARSPALRTDGGAPQCRFRRPSRSEPGVPGGGHAPCRARRIARPARGWRTVWLAGHTAPTARNVRKAPNRRMLEEHELFPLNLYDFWTNPLNYTAWTIDRLSSLFLRLHFLLVVRRRRSSRRSWVLWRGRVARKK